MSNEGPVLCATDFSPCASQICGAGLKLAAALGTLDQLACKFVLQIVTLST